MITKPGKVVVHNDGQIVCTNFTFKHTGKRKFPDIPFAEECAYDAMNWAVGKLQKAKREWKDQDIEGCRGPNIVIGGWTGE